MSLHCMLDLETLSTSRSAAIVAIGAVVFESDPSLPPDIRKFYTGVKLGSAMRSGGVVDAGTILWWMQQSDVARMELQKAQDVGQTLRKALYDFHEWLSRHRVRNDASVPVWGNGADFDNVVLRNAYESQEIAPPWDHRDNRCFRTVKNLFPVDFPRGTEHGVYHNAVDDAEYQAHWLRAIFAKMQAGGPLPELAPKALRSEPAVTPAIAAREEAQGFRKALPQEPEDPAYLDLIADAGNTAGL